MKKNLSRVLLKCTGLCLCVLPPFAATLLYFPLWREAGDGRLLSGFTLSLLLLCAVPLYRHLKAWLKTSAIYMPWLLLFLLFLLLSRIAREMTVISFTGLVGNIIGSVLMKIGNRPLEKQ